MTTSLPAGTTATAVAAGGSFSLAVTSTGQVLAWGLNTLGQLGNGTNTNSNIPVSVSLPSGTTVTAVAAGGNHSLAVTSTGGVLAWGDNTFGQLGNGTNTNSNVPVSTSLPSGTTVLQGSFTIAAGSNFSLAISTTAPPPTTTTTTKTVTKTTTTTICCHDENNENNNNDNDENHNGDNGDNGDNDYFEHYYHGLYGSR